MPEIWMMLRQDDNGQVFVVADHLTCHQARVLLETHTARGHKQVYLLEPYNTDEQRAQIVLRLAPHS